MAASDSGMSQDSSIPGAVLITLIVFLSIALYNVVELNFILFATFKKWHGLYFWSFFVSTWGIAPYCIGFLLKDLNVSSNNILYVTLIVVGWCCMVTGQSVVLYSRLHLVMRNQFRLRAVLIMIIFDAVICHTPTIVMVYGANSANPEPFLLPYTIYEKVQVTIFFLQELIISGLYIMETLKLMRVEDRVRGNNAANRTMTHLLLVNVIIVALDITILSLEYSGHYDIQTAYKGLVYSVKLKLEFSILNKLVELTQREPKPTSSFNRSRAEREGGVMSLNTIDKERNKRLVRDGTKNGLGYKASVHSEGCLGGTGKGGGVVMTTEVMVQSHGQRADGNCERHLESMDTNYSETMTGSATGEAEGPRGVSAASSEVQFAKVSF